MPKNFQIIYLACFLTIFTFFLHQGVQAAACSPVPVSGTTTITTDCAFAGTVNGVENGPLVINASTTLTINGGRTVVWNPGYSVFINGTIFIDKSAGGGQLRKTYLWMIDADSDGYPESRVQYASSSSPGASYKRRSTFFPTWTNVSQIAIENVATGKSCSTYCMENGSSTCASIGKNTNATDTKYQGLDATYQTTCTEYSGGVCSTVMTAYATSCSANTTTWTRCLCDE